MPEDGNQTCRQVLKLNAPGVLKVTLSNAKPIAFHTLRVAIALFQTR